MNMTEWKGQREESLNWKTEKKRKKKKPTQS